MVIDVPSSQSHTYASRTPDGAWDSVAVAGTSDPEGTGAAVGGVCAGDTGGSGVRPQPAADASPRTRIMLVTADGARTAGSL